MLDSKLPNFIQLLNDAFLAYLLHSSDKYVPDEVRAAVPLPRVICKLLYTFCKVRGQKVIVRFLSNEARYLQPLITAVRTWGSVQITRPENGGGRSFIWEEKYIMLLWLSHLMLIPFDLATASYGEALSSADVQTSFSSTLPPVTLSVLTLGLENLDAAGKERESASALLVRLALRPDMQRAGVLKNLVDLVISRLATFKRDKSLPVYHLLGTLAVLSGLFNSGTDDDIAPFLVQCFQICHEAASSESSDLHALNTSANSRKLLIKIMRSIVLKAILLESKGGILIGPSQLSGMLEDVIDYLLHALADKDTPIRFAAAKALSMITLKLEPSMAEEIVEAVIASLGENMLYEMPGSGKLVAATDLNRDETELLKPNLTAADPLHWQGLMLTLAHLLYRRCPTTDQLPAVLKALVAGMSFEQRSPTGVSVGTGVRDAACFGLWAVSRRYTTSELMQVEVRSFAYSALSASQQQPEHIMQAIACHLVASGCLDPSGNIRRGSSAALQELIGRHPDTIEQAISLVQVVDYHAVARRSRAVLEVAVAAAGLSPLYHSALEDALYGWRGIQASDAESRRVAANAIGKFCRLSSSSSMIATTDRVKKSLQGLPAKGSGAILELRHGLILTLSHTIVPLETTETTRIAGADTENLRDIVESFQGKSRLLGEPLKRSAPRAELIFEASSSLITSLCKTRQVHDKSINIPQVNLDFMVERLNLHLEMDNEVVIEESTQAVKSLFFVMPLADQDRIIYKWIDAKNKRLHSFSSKGRIAALGALAGQVEEDQIKAAVVAQLQRFVQDEWPVEVRTAALRSLADARLSPNDADDSIKLAAVLCSGLSDYTTDQRGDVGSLARLEAIRYTNVMFEVQPSLKTNEVFAQEVIPFIARLASEKLDKVRHQAWTCLEKWWRANAHSEPSDGSGLPPLSHKISHMAETSSLEYFDQLLSLLPISSLQMPLLQGLITSACGGTENLIRTTREALMTHLLTDTHPDPEYRLSIYHSLNSVLETNLTDDRYAAPAMEILGFLLSLDLLTPSTQDLSNNAQSKARSLYKQTFTLNQKAHFKSTNVPRLEAAIKAYEGLLFVEESSVRRDVVRKLTGMLLHPYPKIRNSVADMLFMHFDHETVRRSNWGGEVKGLKGRVEGLREELLKRC